MRPLPAHNPSTTPALAWTRRRLLAVSGLAGASLLASCGPGARDETSTGTARPATASSPDTPDSPEKALARLEAGNRRFAAGEASHPRQGVAGREAVAEHQHPWALVHGCVDSRVSPELVFDQGLGDLFATRTAAAVLDDTIVGSMEFALGATYGVPLIVILGHTGCGAVTATVDALAGAPARPQAPGEILDIVREIAPVARRVPADPDRAAYIDAVVRANTRSVADTLVRRSAIVRDAVTAGRTRVVPAVYDLTSGLIEWEVA